MKMTKRITSYMIAMIMALLLTASAAPATVNAASEYYTVKEFADALAEELGLSPVTYPLITGNIDALMVAGIIKEGDFKNYDRYMTRTDTAILINRADEYLNKTVVDDYYVNMVIEKRIADIKEIKESKRVDVAKAFYKGYIVGYYNGLWSTDRTLNGGYRIKRTAADKMIKMLKNKKLRAKMSLDGQVCRTTNLPTYAKYYPYILASYPNSYYGWKFRYQLITKVGIRPDGTYGEITFKNMEHYASPKSLAKDTDYFMDGVTPECLDLWADKVKTHLECVFNVDYRTINEQWVQQVFDTTYSVGDISANEEFQKSEIRKYVANMKANKTIVEASAIAVDPSSIYYYDGRYFARAYVRYRIVSSNVKFADQDTLKKTTDKYFNCILYSSYIVRFKSFTEGKWRTCCFDVEIAANQITIDDPTKKGVGETYLIEHYFTDHKLK